MARATWVQTNFNGGEWSPLAYGRFDLAKYKNGLATCLNYMPTQQGGLTRRPGTRYVAAVKDSSYAPRLQRFEFSITQAYVLEFGNLYIRFYTSDGQLQNTGVPVEVVTPYTSSEVWGLNFAQSADTLYITHPNHPPMKLQRASAYVWTLNAISFLDGPYLPVNVTSTTLTPSDTTGTVTVTASSAAGINNGAGFRAQDVGRALRIKCGGVWVWGTISAFTDTTHVSWAISTKTGAQLPRNARATANFSAGSIFSYTIQDGGSGYGAQPPAVSNYYKPVSVAVATVVTDANGVITSVNMTGHGNYAGTPFARVNSATGYGASLQPVWDGISQVTSVSVVGGGIGYTNGESVTFYGGGTGSATTAAVAYATLTNGVVTSITVSVTGAGYASAPDVMLDVPTPLTPATTTFWRLGEWNSVDGYPNAVIFHQDRLCFAGASANPGRVDASNSGDYENFAPTNQDGTVVDSNALAFSLNSGSVNAIRWLVSDEWGLLAGTAGGEWAISPSTTQQAITPTNVNAKQLGNFGSASVPPIRVGKATLFIQRTGRKLREMVYQFMYNTFQTLDISLVSEHLTQTGFKQMAVQFAPQQIIWAVLNGGGLTGITYDKDQDICGWHEHNLGGYSDAAQTLPPLVESVAAIPSPNTQRDEVWMVVNRYINGATVRTVELMSKLWEDGDSTVTCNFLDSSAEGDYPSGTTTVSGLTWLVGQTVGVLTDGAVHPDCVVDSSGHITLQRTAYTVQAGLKYTSKAVTLRVEAGGADGPSQGKLKRIYRLVVRFFQSVGLTVGSDTLGVDAYPETFRTSADPMSGPVGLFDGDKRWAYEGTWDTEGQITFETSDPLPSNITMLMAQLETQDAQ